MPRANIDWNKIPASAIVCDRGTHYVVVTGRKKAVAIWSSFDAKQAQATLWARSNADQRKCGDIMRREAPLPGLHGKRRRR